MGHWRRVLGLGLVGLAVGCGCAGARDLGQWGDVDPSVSAWFRALMQPDTYPQPSSCCGEGDAYWADEVRVRGGKMYAVITDDRPDGDCSAVLGGKYAPCRYHEEVGTEYEVPPRKIVGREAHGNPTGHIVIFLGAVVHLGGGKDKKRDVLCYVPNGGV